MWPVQNSTWLQFAGRTKVPHNHEIRLMHQVSQSQRQWLDQTPSGSARHPPLHLEGLPWRQFRAGGHKHHRLDWFFFYPYTFRIFLNLFRVEKNNHENECVCVCVCDIPPSDLLFQIGLKVYYIICKVICDQMAARRALVIAHCPANTSRKSRS